VSEIRVSIELILPLLASRFMRVVIPSGNLDELHLRPCSAATQLASRKQQQLESNSIDIKIASSPKPL
jgi:hypothetical protein